MPTNEYVHFLTLSCAVTICSCEIYKPLLPLAGSLFSHYVEEYACIYGKNTIGSNVHILLHIIEDMQHNEIGNLSQLSTYKFENTLRLLGMKLQSCNRPLEQIARRLIEISNLNINMNQSFGLDKFIPFVEYELPCENDNYKLFSKIHLKPDIVLSSRKFGDQWFLTCCGDVVKMIHAVQIDKNKYKIVGYPLLDKSNFFTQPLTSSKLNIFMSSGQIHTESRLYDISSVRAKMIFLQFETNFVAIPLLHTLEALNK